MLLESHPRYGAQSDPPAQNRDQRSRWCSEERGRAPGKLGDEERFKKKKKKKETLPLEWQLIRGDNKKKMDDPEEADWYFTTSS